MSIDQSSYGEYQLGEQVFVVHKQQWFAFIVFLNVPVIRAGIPVGPYSMLCLTYPFQRLTLLLHRNLNFTRCALAMTRSYHTVLRHIRVYAGTATGTTVITSICCACADAWRSTTMQDLLCTPCAGHLLLLGDCRPKGDPSKKYISCPQPPGFREFFFLATDLLMCF